MASPQVEGKFVRQQEKYSSIEKKELGELDKNVLLLLFIPTPLLNSFCCILEPPFINTPPAYSGPKSSCFTKDQSLGFIPNNYSAFVNSSLHLTLCGDGVYICKFKKNKVSCHAVSDKLLVEWLPRELNQL